MVHAAIARPSAGQRAAIPRTRRRRDSATRPGRPAGVGPNASNRARASTPPPLFRRRTGVEPPRPCLVCTVLCIEGRVGNVSGARDHDLSPPSAGPHAHCRPRPRHPQQSAAPFLVTCPNPHPPIAGSASWRGSYKGPHARTSVLERDDLSKRLRLASSSAFPCSAPKLQIARRTVGDRRALSSLRSVRRGRKLSAEGRSRAASRPTPAAPIPGIPCDPSTDPELRSFRRPPSPSLRGSPLVSRTLPRRPRPARSTRSPRMRTPKRAGPCPTTNMVGEGPPDPGFLPGELESRWRMTNLRLTPRPRPKEEGHQAPSTLESASTSARGVVDFLRPSARSAPSTPDPGICTWELGKVSAAGSRCPKPIEVVQTRALHRDPQLVDTRCAVTRGGTTRNGKARDNALRRPPLLEDGVNERGRVNGARPRVTFETSRGQARVVERPTTRIGAHPELCSTKSL